MTTGARCTCRPGMVRGIKGQADQPHLFWNQECPLHGVGSASWARESAAIHDAVESTRQTKTGKWGRG